MEVNTPKMNKNVNPAQQQKNICIKTKIQRYPQ